MLSTLVSLVKQNAQIDLGSIACMHAQICTRELLGRKIYILVMGRVQKIPAARPLGPILGYPIPLDTLRFTTRPIINTYWQIFLLTFSTMAIIPHRSVPYYIYVLLIDLYVTAKPSSDGSVCYYPDFGLFKIGVGR